ncbi:MAG: DUF927 domain-containing protein [Deltaproteobacteria bacterium]|nr:DUF927 domain-containing protein [Deltaproteobacteria bacterium]
MKFCKEGKEVAHVISQRDASRYNARELDRQFASVGIAGPPRCATFQGENPVPCADCPWLGQVNSPIEIPGKLIPTLESKLIPFENEDFRVIPGEGLFHIHYPETRRNQQQREPVIYKINRNEFYITEVQADTEGIQEKLYIQLKVRSPGQAPRSVYFSVDEHYGQFNFPKWLANHRLLPIKRKYNDLMSDFMSSYIERLQDNVTCEQKSHFGWSSYYDSKIGDKVDSFVVGTSMLTPDGETKVALNPKCRVMADREFQVKGDLEAWKVIPDMYKTLDQKEAQLFMCGSFAAPFMRYGLGTAKNLILSMWDAKGGKGKSTLLQAINSVWGHPINMSCSKNDTMSARFQVLSARKNLPFCLDELTTMKEDDLSPLLFDIANGQERRKSGRSGDVLLSTGDWSTITFVTSNRSIYELMRAQSSQTTAESMRVVELPCAFRNYAGTELGGYIEDCLWLLHNNYGLAGPAFMAECFKNPQYFEEVAAEARAWDAVQRQTSEERFWSYGLGTILAVGRLAVRLGYLNYDMDALESWVVKTLFPEIRHKISDGLKSAVNLLGEYYTSNINKVLVVTAAERTTEIRPHMSIQMDTYVKRYPANSLAMRLEIDTQTLYVRLNSISEWCINQRVSWSEMKTQLVNENIWDGKTSQINLAKDVETLGRVSVCCLKLDLSKCEPLACLNEQGEIYDSN